MGGWTLAPRRKSKIDSILPISLDQGQGPKIPRTLRTLRCPIEPPETSERAPDLLNVKSEFRSFFFFFLSSSRFLLLKFHRMERKVSLWLLASFLVTSSDNLSFFLSPLFLNSGISTSQQNHSLWHQVLLHACSGRPSPFCHPPNQAPG